MVPNLISIEEVITETRVDAQLLHDGIGRKWVRPLEREGRFLFDEADRARVRLIAELRIDLEVQEDALPMILGLLDQLYALRRTLSDLRGAIAELPEETRALLEARLREPPES